MDDLVLGLDIGTTSTKALLFDLSGACLATAEQGYPLLTPQPDWAEQDPEAVWQALVAVLRAVAGPAGGRQVALSLAAQSGSLLPARSDGTPLGPIITWMDGRTTALVAGWGDAGVQDWVRPLSGWHLYPGLCLPTIAWLRRHQPDLFAAAGHWFSVNDFLVWRLTGRLCTNPSNAGGMQLLDVRTGTWSPALCDLAGIRPDQLSPVQPSGAVTGRISPEVSRLTGLPAETVVVNGGHDQGCTALGLGVTAPGQVLLGCGTAWVVTAVAGSPDVAALPDSLDLNWHPFPGRWTASQSLGGLGASLDWLLRQFWPAAGPASAAARAEAFAALDRELAHTRPGGGGLYFLPLTGGHQAPAGEARGAVLGLGLDHGRADLARAVMEGVACELRWALDGIRRTGMPIQTMSMIGGAARSPLWPAIVAGVCNVPLELPQASHGPAVGAAILAGVGLGAFESMAAGQACFAGPRRRLDPDPAVRQVYDDYLSAYQRQARHRQAARR